MKNPKLQPYLYAMLAGFGAISLSLLLFFFVYRLKGVGAVLDTIVTILLPFVYGSVIAYLLRPMCNWYSRNLDALTKHKYPKYADIAAIILSVLTGLAIVYALIIMIGPQLYQSLAALWVSVPGRIRELQSWLAKTFGENEELLAYFDTSSREIYNTLDNWAKTTLIPYIKEIVNGVGMSVWKVLLFFYNLLIGLIVAVYLLVSRKKFARQSVMLVRSVLKPKWADKFLEEVDFIDRMFGGFIDGKVVDSAIIGVLCYIGCTVFRFPNPLLIATIVGVTNIIPFFGPFLGAIPSVLLILIVDPMKAVWFSLFVLFLQQLDGNVIGPKILGDHTGVSSFWVLFSILLFGGLWGIVGMVIAVPLFAVIYDLIRRLVIRGLHRNGREDLIDNYRAEFCDTEGKK